MFKNKTRHLRSVVTGMIEGVVRTSEKHKIKI